MSTGYVRGYAENSGGSHLFALWVQQTPPDEDDLDGWAWVRGDKVLWARRFHDRDLGIYRTQVVFDGGNTLTTDATPEDVRWGIDLALNGGKHRTPPAMSMTNETANEAWREASLAGFLAAEALLKRERDG
jgi:hypothetical protein